jgi:hypothetical protein
MSALALFLLILTALVLCLFSWHASGDDTLSLGRDWYKFNHLKSTTAQSGEDGGLIWYNSNLLRGEIPSKSALRTSHENYGHKQVILQTMGRTVWQATACSSLDLRKDFPIVLR